MTRKIDYYYNPETLKLEKVKRDKRKPYFIVAGILVLSAILIFVFEPYLKNINLKVNQLEKKQIEYKNKISDISQRFKQKDNILNNLIDKENNVYRPLISLQSISTEMLQPGFGGSKQNDGMFKIAVLDTLNLMVKSIGIKTSILRNISSETDKGIKELEKRMVQIPSVQPIAPKDLLRIGDGFNPNRFHPILKYRRPHKGIDLIAQRGRTVYAPSKGKVLRTRYSLSFGNVVEIDHGFNITTLYGHLSKILVKPGDIVNMGDTIGLVGSTGLSSGAHLHYEVHKNGVPVDPQNYIHTYFKQEEFQKILEK